MSKYHENVGSHKRLTRCWKELIESKCNIKIVIMMRTGNGRWQCVEDVLGTARISRIIKRKNILEIALGIEE